MYKVAYLTDKGLKKESNEDSLLVKEACGLFVVADGMGGHERGEVASQIVVESFEENICKDEDSTVVYSDEESENETVSYLFDEDEEATIAYGDGFNKQEELGKKLNSAVEISTRKIVKYAKDKVLGKQIGTTVVGLCKVKNEEEMALFHLGDSRAYRVRNKEIEKLTSDHSKYEQMKQSGKYSEDELAKVNRNSITKAIGNFKVMPLEMTYIELEQDDIYILCSDGISDLIHAKEILSIVEEDKNYLENIVLNIKKIVYERGAKDNLSMIIFKYGA